MAKNKLFLFHIFIFVSLIANYAHALEKTKGLPEHEKAVNRKFSSLCATLQAQPLQTRIGFLLNFISHQPNYFLAYERLRNELFWYNKKEKAYEIFTKLAKDEQTSAGGSWLLAQLARIDGQDEKTAKYLRRALTREPDEQRFIYDFFNFYNYCAPPFLRSSIQALADSLAQKSATYIVISAYRKNDFQKVESQLHLMADDRKYSKIVPEYRFMLYWKKGQWQQAKACLSTAVHEAKKVENKYLQAQLYNKLVSLLTTLRDYRNALVYADSASSIAQELHDPFLTAVASIYRAGALSGTRNFKKTIAILEEILPHLKLSSDYKLLISACWRLGYAYSLDGDYLSALKTTALAEKYVNKVNGESWRV